MVVRVGERFFSLHLIVGHQSKKILSDISGLRPTASRRLASRAAPCGSPSPGTENLQEYEFAVWKM